VTSARHEAIIALSVWAVATVYSVGYCALYGYGRSPESLTFVLWFPDWIFWGVIVPWFCCAAISVWFAMFYMSDDDLGVAAEGDGTDEGDAAAQSETTASPPHSAPEREKESGNG